MIPFIIAAIPIDYPQVKDWSDINRAAQIATKKEFPWWWNKYGCEGTTWYPEDEPCRDLTND